MNTKIVTQRLAMADAPRHAKKEPMLARIITVLMAATLAGGLLATDAQARGGGGIGSHFGGTRVGSSVGRGFHGNHRHGGYGPGYAYGYDWGCSPYGPYGSSWPNVCY